MAGGPEQLTQGHSHDLVLFCIIHDSGRVWCHTRCTTLSSAVFYPCILNAPKVISDVEVVIECIYLGDQYFVTLACSALDTEYDIDKV